LDKHNNLVICQHADHAIAKLNGGTEVSIIADTYNRKRFNSPNDVVVKKDGYIYFTDPPYGLKDQVLWPDRFQPLGGVYCFNKTKTMLVSTDFRFPNGLCLSRDEKYLFVGSNHPAEPYIRKYEAGADGRLLNGTVFLKQNADGIKTDNNDNLYMATNEGILIVSPGATRLALVPLPESPANLTFGGPDKSSLFVTARSSVYMIQLK
jgi:gluconolactonase